MRKFGFLFILAGVLAFIAFQARTGIFRRAHPGKPANKYVREMQEAQELAPGDLELIQQKYADAVVTASGLRYVVRRAGTGSPPSLGAEVVAHYRGTLINGMKFDSSYDRGEPFAFRVGTGAVIKGWDEAFAQMRKGEQRTLIIPWWLGYGIEGKGPIPPRATLIFEVELLDIR
ncbi:FKBP-type peptidyl-prolyl cis-trans isomerase [Oleiharenicola sp. Vm1]|uniref:FKBP-type peptidyl-prolyl cis-trans isomerase n=1 Tax=Oleiharenicola sp. Vm1 TaxID=3398393 RepID=UPI0039F63560